MTELPVGTLTFVLTDIEGSTRLWEREPEAMATAMLRHDALFAGAVEGCSGFVVRPRGEGDSRFAVFPGARDAVAAAVRFQEDLYREAWPISTPLRVRIALHTGEADLRNGDYYGTTVNRCARIRALAHGGQTLLSDTTAQIVQGNLPDGLTLHNLGEHELKDLTRHERIFQIGIPGLPAEFPPLSSPARRPTNLPAETTTFVGREREIHTARGAVKTLRLLVVEDEALFRQMLIRILDDEPGLEVAGDADNGEAAVELAEKTQPDVVLMDIELPGALDGIDAGLAIKRARPETGIVLLSSHRDRRYFTSLPLEQQPGWSYLLKQSVADVDTLIRAIEGSANGMVVLDPALVTGMLPKPDTALSRLTPRQRDVLDLMAQGYSNAGIAEQLILTERSVETYVSVIYQELGVSGERETHARVKATLIALEESQSQAW